MAKFEINKRLPVTEQQNITAQQLYGKDFKDLAVDQRTTIRSGKKTFNGITFEEYLDDYTKMASDPTYEPKYVKPNVGSGRAPQQIRAKTEAQKNITGFQNKYNANINKRKKLKAQAKFETLPAEDQLKIKQAKMAKKGNIRRTRRVAKLADKASLTPNEKYLNFQQSLITRQLNDKIKANPNLILKNNKLIDDLSTTVSKDGDIIKIKPTLSESELKKRGLYEIEHQRDIYKKGAMKDYPYNRNLILSPHNRSGGFKNNAEEFIKNNPTSNKIPAILAKADELKITLQPDVPQGTFKTKGLGYKQIPDAVEKFKLVATDTMPNLVDDKLGMASYNKDISMAKKALGFAKTIGKAKTTIPAAAMTFLATKANSTPTYNSEIGAIVKPGTSDDVESQSGLLDWAAANPELTATAAVGGAGLTTAGNTLLRGLIKTMGTPALGVGLAGSLVADNMSKGESLPEALADPMAGLGLLGSSSFSKGLGSLLGGAKLARSLTPVGAAMTAAGLGKDYYDFASDEIDKMDAMSDYDRRIYNDMLMDDTNIDF